MSLPIRAGIPGPTLEALVDHIDQPGIDGDPARDITRVLPDITQEEALQVQIAVKRRRVASGDRIIGHQASFTSAGVLKLFPSAPRAMVGTLLASIIRADGDQVTLDTDEVFIESELGLILKRDLEGPQLTATQVLSAVDAFLPAIEVAPLRPGVREGQYSWAHMIAVQKAFGGYIVLGNRLTAPHGLDPRLEGCLVSIDSVPRAGAIGFEAMGNPLNVVAAMARRLSAIGEKLHAGEVLITGTLAPPQVVTAANRVARVDFQTLGSVCVQFEPQEGSDSKLLG